MARRPSTGPTERELDILEVLWRGEQHSVRDVHRALSEREKVSISAVQTVLLIMYEKRLVEGELEGRA